MSDDLGDRMKDYESRETARRLLPYLPVYARIDGRCFSNFTRRMDRPYDVAMSDAMVATTRRLVEETQALTGYTQSDEISLIWLVDKPKTQMLFDGKVQKLVSVLASLATVTFDRIARETLVDKTSGAAPTFDCRVFQLPTLDEGANAILWREVDATKNAVSMAARAHYSSRDLHGKSGPEMQEMLFQKGINFNDYPAFFKRGTFIQRRTRLVHLTDVAMAGIPPNYRPTGPIERSLVERITMPPFRKVTNRAGVIFRGEDPCVESSETNPAHPRNCIDKTSAKSR